MKDLVVSDKNKKTPSQNSKVIPKYYIRFSQAEDLDRLVEFYTDNSHKNVRQREIDAMKPLIEDGFVAFIEDENGEVVGSSISYPHKVKENGVEKVKWLEIGTARITLNGYISLFDVMTVSQVLRAYLVEPPEDRFVARMDMPQVRALAERLGWRSFEPPEELLDISNSTVDQNKEAGKDRSDGWYQSGVEGLPVMAKFLIDALESPILTNKKTGDQVEISIERSKVLKIFKENIKNLTGRDYGSIDKPDMSKGVAKHRQEWLRRWAR